LDRVADVTFIELQYFMDSGSVVTCSRLEIITTLRVRFP
jgi:hypothetical protein